MNSEIIIFHPIGILDNTSGALLQQKVVDAIEAGKRMVLINFYEVTFMDSAGLTILMTCMEKMRQIQGRLILCDLNDQIKMLMALTGMTEQFEIFPSQAEFNQRILAG